MTTAEIKEIAERIADAKDVVGDLSGNRLKYAEDLYAHANQGAFKTPRFYFQLAVECLKAVGLQITERGQEKLL